ncbi:hypothetical protein [Parapedobacter defluvii]|uniref:hypothetical protein n=1 Tax=Parapedobacter defluvii TaxID=2045106 RepID=UPI001662CCDE|nr:hypothetical protein [Parapedobacter defluvii]
MKSMIVLSVFVMLVLTSCSTTHSRGLSSKEEMNAIQPEVWEIELMAVSGQSFTPFWMTDKMGLIPLGLDVNSWNADKAILRLQCPKDSSTAVYRFCETLRENGQFHVMRLSRLE